ncbi:MAG: D-hexose-6-phosphate mutarotase [Propionibacteriaceae bacterium]|jgi:glucose-6-phosphate 1-epimerase|nr:D-hexose-6-phosphate mutarotase [Propionibacteriaceae bacterium]
MTPLLPPRQFVCPTATGTIYHHGAHVTDWTPTGERPVLWLSEHAQFKSGSAIRGGVPICWPWFGGGQRGTASPLHGFARLTNWYLVRTDETAESVTATYLLVNARRDKFDFSYRLTYVVSFGRELTATLTVRNTDVRRFTFEAALHAYLAVGDIRQLTVTGLEDTEFLDRVAGHEIGPHHQTGDVTFEGETDRIYHATGEIGLADPVIGRRLSLTRTGSEDAVVWNPWVAKAHAMTDFGDDEWTSMVCVETANVAEHAVTLHPGREHVMGFTLRTAPLG